MYDELVTLISSVGFPIVVSCYCLTTLNNTMLKLTEAVNVLKNIIEKRGDSDD